MKLSNKTNAFVISLVASLTLATVAIASDSMSSEMPPASITALSPLASGILGGALCNYDIHPAAGAEFLKNRLGPNTTFNLEGVTQALWFATAQRSAQEQLGAFPVGKVAIKKYCGDVLKWFGTDGTQIKGLVSP